MASSYLKHIFIAGAPAAGGGLPAGHAVVSGLLFGLGQGLPASGAGQAFAWTYLAGWVPAAGAWSLPLLAAAAGLAALLWPSWTDLFAPTGPGSRPGTGAPGAPSWQAIAAAAIPCWLVQWRLTGLGLRLEAAGAVGLLLVVTGLVLRAGERWAGGLPETEAEMSPWLALAGGIVAGLGALPGLSGLAVLIATGLYGRMGLAGAVRFALMTITAVMAITGLTGLRHAFSLPPLSLLLLCAGAFAGAWVGGWILGGGLGRLRLQALPVLASYVSGVGGILVLFGVFAK